MHRIFEMEGDRPGELVLGLRYFSERVALALILLSFPLLYIGKLGQLILGILLFILAAMIFSIAVILHYNKNSVINFLLSIEVSRQMEFVLGIKIPITPITAEDTVDKLVKKKEAKSDTVAKETLAAIIIGLIPLTLAILLIVSS